MLKNIVKDLKPSSTLAINEASKKLEDEGKIDDSNIELFNKMKNSVINLEEE